MLRGTHISPDPCHYAAISAVTFNEIPAALSYGRLIHLLVQGHYEGEGHILTVTLVQKIIVVDLFCGAQRSKPISIIYGT